MKNALCFGAAGGGERLFDEISQRYTLIGFVDNDKRKVGGNIRGVEIYEPKVGLKMDWDIIVITSAPGMESIKHQLLNMGVDRGRIDTSFIENPLISRITFLKRMAQIQNIKTASVAEVGVFEGDFAKWINNYYCNQTLHLFDTFEGFDERDISKEEGLSEAKVGDYSNTSMEAVLEKMPYPAKVVFHKGYFPETASDIKDSFCFVNLDLDLYEPTYQGLLYFENKMIHGGVILVHDYFATNFQGPQKAVDQFIRETNGRYAMYPIGDGISVMITGF